MQLLTIKTGIITAAGVIGSFVAALLGGWTDAMTSLAILMLLDIVTGLLVAARAKSLKSECGGLSSKAMSAGLCRKGMIIIIILAAAQLDNLLGIDYVKTGAVITFCVNEILSIIENAGLMGIKLPGAVTKAIDLLQSKGDNAND